ncbi:MAG: radical SAM protein [Clostridia bacterium]|nr:radical SAM protein [Clostridia bacterium]
MLNIHRILRKTKAEGPGTRFCVWLQGCSRHCDGCFAFQTWSHEPNILMTPDELTQQILSEKEIEGITVLGGEPFEQAGELSKVITAVHQKLSVIVFTGFTAEQLHSLHDPYTELILQNTDVLIDGAYIKNQRSFDRPMVGSANQNFIFLTDRYTFEDFPPNTVEIRIRQNGKIEMNGMGDFEEIARRFKEKNEL